MPTLTQKYNALKQRVGGNREIRGYEETFGMPREEQQYITPPNKNIRRILGEIEFAVRLSEVNGGKFDADIEKALDYLSAQIETDGVLTNSACTEAEKMLLVMADTAKEYKLILAGHAHIDMNWMWSWHETVAATLATFKTMLAIMDEYPDFTFSQSQASVYKIVEDFEPEMMEAIKKRIKEGRWEITASAWVETDKNMPNTESLLRHIQYTKNYLRDSWGVDPASLEVDFSPDTFGHSANVPEIDANGGVKYYYHCRALDGKQALYRWRAQSGAEMLVYREQYWYNSAITPKIGAGLIDISKRCAGFKTGLIVYGVGDHGGGPTRRDVERAVDMMSWPVYPQIKFGTFSEFFKEAEAVRDLLPIEEHELNYFAPGCYTTQSRIKLGNRHCEAALYEAENLSAYAAQLGKGKFKSFAVEKAWRDVLFTHFHDILTGSCVQDSREHAMGLYSNSLAVAQTESLNAMAAISENTDTSMVVMDSTDDAQSFGAGAGYGVENFAGTPIPERGAGLTRIFTVFNPSTVKKSEAVEITVWDWIGDMRYVSVTDVNGNPVPFQMIDRSFQQYWDHKYFRVLIRCDIDALGYTTVVLKQAEMEGFYPVYYQNDHRSSGETGDFTLDNEYIVAKFSGKNGSLYSLVDKETGKEYIKDGQAGSFVLIDTERASSSAWDIGRYLKITPINNSVNVRGAASGGLKKGFYYESKVLGSTVKTTVSLEKGKRYLTYKTEVDWHEVGGQTVPVLAYSLPVNYTVEKYRYNIPAGVIQRAPREQDVPGLSYASALTDGRCATIVTDCKYGYRGTNDGTLISTLINSSTSPDPYPERGIHKITLCVGILDNCAQAMEETAVSICHPLTYHPTKSHKGTLPATDSIFGFESSTAVISAVSRTTDNALTVRMYAVCGEGEAAITMKNNVTSAAAIDLMENEIPCDITVDGNKVKVKVSTAKVVTVKIK